LSLYILSQYVWQCIKEKLLCVFCIFLIIGQVGSKQIIYSSFFCQFPEYLNRVPSGKLSLDLSSTFTADLRVLVRLLGISGLKHEVCTCPSAHTCLYSSVTLELSLPDQLADVGAIGLGPPVTILEGLSLPTAAAHLFIST
jgi:hypothetical protein